MKAFSVFSSGKKKKSISSEVLTPASYYNKCADKIKFVKYTVALVLILYIVYGVWSNGSELNLENFRYMMKYLDFSSSNAVVSGKEIIFDQDGKAEIGVMRDNLVAVDGSGVNIYDLNGQRSLKTSFNFAYPAIAVSDKFLFAYDLGMGSNTLKIFNVYSEIKSYTYDYPIYGVAVNPNGAYCVITAERGYTSGFIAYDSANRLIYRKSYGSRHVVSVDISDEGKDFYALLVSASDGDFVAEVAHYNMSGEKEQHILKYLGEYPLKVERQPSGDILVLTDKALRFYSESFELKKEIDLENESMKRFFFEDDHAIITYGTQIVGNSARLKLFDVGGNILVDEYFDGDILRARVNEGKLYIMIKGKLVIYDMKTAQRKTMTLEPRYSDFAFVSGGIVFISQSGAQYIDFYNINSAAK
ncbi:MAG: hypothetical protein IJN75_03765 [Clostridia bacterium]|nr:hypothetical protein [Clostridia bacterium]